MLDRVLAGIAAAKQAGLEPIKINAVIVRGHNEDEVADFAAFAREHDVEDALHRVYAAGFRPRLVAHGRGVRPGDS